MGGETVIPEVHALGNDEIKLLFRRLRATELLAGGLLGAKTNLLQGMKSGLTCCIIEGTMDGGGGDMEWGKTER